MKISCDISVEQARELFSKSSTMRDLYVWYFNRYNFYDTIGLWSYWFARVIIHDHWPAAESLIDSDLNAKKNYHEYLSILRQAKLIGRSLVSDADFISDDNGVILGWRGESELYKLVLKRAEEYDATHNIRKPRVQQLAVERFADSFGQEMAIEKMRNRNINN